MGSVIEPTKIPTAAHGASSTFILRVASVGFLPSHREVLRYKELLSYGDFDKLRYDI